MTEIIKGFILGERIEIKCSSKNQADVVRRKLECWLDELDAPAYLEKISSWPAHLKQLDILVGNKERKNERKNR